MSILIIDNYDSFTYNLLHLVEKVCDEEISVYQNNKISLSQIGEYDKIIFSPGCGIPKEAGILLECIKIYAKKKKMLGVCLGMQAIGEAFGASLKNLPTVFHGVQSPIFIKKEDTLFADIPKTYKVGRYHSWVVDEYTLPSCLEVLAVDEQENTMALRHRTLPIKGVQFHPESVLSEYGEQLIKNWIHNE
ncbi:MAG: aminodeoxychorismate/anthranilate synthase component II [Bacteroidetes bacterium]|nr:aminodeoxychorismate/anthranilate synthase component II [Bacteroidota bacterium]